MRFKVENQMAGLNLKNKIIGMLNKVDDFVTIAEVRELCGEVPLSVDEKYHGWYKNVYLEHKIRVRETKKSGWCLYLPDPVYIPDLLVEPIDKPAPEPEIDDHDMTEVEKDVVETMRRLSRESKDVTYILAELMYSIFRDNKDDADGRRKCMVWKKSKKKDVLVEEWPCWFHCWSSNRIAKEHGTIVDQLLAVCEFQDGHVERINFDHIRFVEEWD